MTSPGGYSAGTLFLQIVPSFRGFQTAVRREAKAANQSVQEELGKGMGSEGEKAGRDYGKGLERGTGRYVAELRAKIAAALENLPDAEIGIDSRAADAELKIIRARLAALQDADLSVHVNMKEAQKQLALLKTELKDIAIRNTDVDVIVNAGRAFIELDKIKLDLDEIDHKRATAHVEVDGLDSSGTAFRAFNGYLLTAVTLGPALVPILGAMAGGLLGLASAGAGAAAGLGVAVLAFSGILTAVKALSAQQDASTKDGLTSAKTTRNAARAVRDAQEGVANARLSAARAAEDAAQRVKDADRSVGDADRSLAQDQKDATQAQRDLIQARKDAAQQAQELADKAAGGKLAERQGVIDVFNATVSNTNAQNDSGATNLDKEQASINLGNAQLHLKQIREENAQTTDAKTKLAKTGVEGSDPVVAAKDNLAKANARVQASEESVTKAVEAAKRAREDQARSAVDSQRQVRDATERVTDAVDAQKDALAGVGTEGSASALAVKNAMAALGPAGQRFAQFIFGLQTGFHGLRDEAENGFLPKLQQGIELLVKTYGPALQQFVGSIAKVLGDLALKTSTALASPEWQNLFSTFATYAPVFLQIWGQVGGQLITIFAEIMAAFAPFAKTLLQGLVDLLAGAQNWSQGLAKSKGFKSFIGYLQKVGPKVVAFLESAVKAFVALVKALAPLGLLVLTGLTKFFDFIADMDPGTLQAVAAAVFGVAAALQLLVGISAAVEIIGTAVEVLSAVADAVLALAAAVGLTVGIVIAVVLAIAAVFVILYLKSKTFRDIVNASMRVVGKVVVWLWDKIIKPYFEFIIGYLKRVWQFWSSVFTILAGLVGMLFDAIQAAWDWFINTGAGKALASFWQDDVVPAWKAGMSVLSSIWDELGDLASTAIRFVVDTVINDGLIDNFNWLAHRFGAHGVDRIKLPAAIEDRGKKTKANTVASKVVSHNQAAGSFAVGGMVPGFSPHPKADNIPAMLTAGEYVLPVHAVSSLRAQMGDGFLENLRRGLPGYALGGLVGNPVNYLMDKVTGLAGDFGKTGFGQILMGVPKKLVHILGSSLGRLITGAVRDVYGGIKGAVGAVGNAFSGGDFKTTAMQTLVQGLAKERGWGTGDQWDALKALVNSESSFNPNSQNPTSTAYGLFQFLDSTWGSYGIRKTADPEQQTIAGLRYIAARYGNPMNAWAFHKQHNYYADGGDVEGPVLYDNGGFLPPGLTTVLNASGRPEPVLSAQQWDHVERGGNGGGDTFPMQVLNGPTADEVAEAVMFSKRVASRGGVYATRET